MQIDNSVRFRLNRKLVVFSGSSHFFFRWRSAFLRERFPISVSESKAEYSTTRSKKVKKREFQEDFSSHAHSQEGAVVILLLLTKGKVAGKFGW